MRNPRTLIRRLSEVPHVSTSHNIGRKAVLLADDEAESAITQIAMTTLKAGEEAEEHQHKTMDEHFLFMEGEGVMKIDDEEIGCECGVFILVPAGSKHSIKAITNMTFLTIGVAL